MDVARARGVTGGMSAGNPMGAPDVISPLEIFGLMLVALFVGSVVASVLRARAGDRRAMERAALVTIGSLVMIAALGAFSIGRLLGIAVAIAAGGLAVVAKHERVGFAVAAVVVSVFVAFGYYAEGVDPFAAVNVGLAGLAVGAAWTVLRKRRDQDRAPTEHAALVLVGALVSIVSLNESMPFRGWIAAVASGASSALVVLSVSKGRRLALLALAAFGFYILIYQYLR